MALPLITVLGPTATGKTHFSVVLAQNFNAEIISADSRQVYKDMDMGTGKDLNEYNCEGKQIPYHLIDIAEAGSQYNVYKYQNDFFNVYTKLRDDSKNIILCGGTGMYIEAVLKNYALIKVPVNNELRKKLSSKSKEELIDFLSELKELHNSTDIEDEERLIRAIEIAHYYKMHPFYNQKNKDLETIIFGISFPRDVIRNRITERLYFRLENGMIEEVKRLLDNNIAPDILKYYGLEYRFITQYLLNELSYSKMAELLNTAIHQFAKRQMTWFRRMERNGFKIHWLDGFLKDEDKLEEVVVLLKTIRTN